MIWGRRARWGSGAPPLGSARAAAHGARTHQVGALGPRRPLWPGGRTPDPLAAETGPRSEVWTTTGAAHPRSAAPFYGGPGGMGGGSPPCQLPGGMGGGSPPCQLKVALRPVLPEPQGWYAVCGARRTTPTPAPATRPAARSPRAISPQCPDGPGKRPREGRGLRRRCPCAAHETPSPRLAELSPRLAEFRGSGRNPIIFMRPLRTGQRRADRGRDPWLAPTRTRPGSGPPGPGRRASRRRPRRRPAGRGHGSLVRAGRPGGSRRHRRRGR
jgi:hypothetical protein